jgi:hypothetical protein
MFIRITGLLLILSAWVPAQQVEDAVYIEGEPHLVRADPLYRYLVNSCTQEMLEDYIDNFSDPYWPNITRTWIIEDGKLYLVRIETRDKKVQYPLKQLFPRYDGKPIFAEWFTGIMSYRSGDSPVIQLNREYYEEEEVIQLRKGVVVETYKVNHRERWIADSRRIMDQYRPLANPPRRADPDKPPPEEGTVEYLEYAFHRVMHPEDGPSFYLPLIVIEFNADVDDLKLTEADKQLTSYNLLQRIAENTGNVLNVAVSNRAVVYAITENLPDGSEASTALSRAQEQTGAADPSE